MKNGSLNGQPVTETAEEGQREHLSTKPDFHGSSVNAKITRPPFGRIWLCQAGVKKAHHLTRIKETGRSQAAPIPSRAVTDGKWTLCHQVTHMLPCRALTWGMPRCSTAMVWIHSNRDFLGSPARGKGVLTGLLELLCYACVHACV